MPSPSTALELIKAAMRQLGVIATGETPTAAEAADGLSALNDVLETWTTEALSVWTVQTLPFTATAGVGAYSIGPTGTFVTDRPVRVLSLYSSIDGVDYPAQEWPYEQYQAVAVKATSSTWPDRYAYLNNFPDGQLFLWPVPATALQLQIGVQQQLTAVPDIATTITYPPGYYRALQWSLAAELSSQYGVELNGQQIAMVNGTKAAIKRANRISSVSRLDRSLLLGPNYSLRGGW
jgi:hypothetical protein